MDYSSSSDNDDVVRRVDILAEIGRFKWIWINFNQFWCNLVDILAKIGEFRVKIGCNLSILVDSKSILDDLGSILVGCGRFWVDLV